MRILFITATRLGDAVLSTGLLAYLHQRWPDARFTIACGPVAAGLFSAFPGLERTIVMEKRPYDLHWLDLWKACVPFKWDITVDLRGSAVTFLLRSGRRFIMRGGRRAGARITHLGNVLNLSPPPLPTVWVSPADRAKAQQIIPNTSPIIALGPTANWTGKSGQQSVTCPYGNACVRHTLRFGLPFSMVQGAGSRTRPPCSGSPAPRHRCRRPFFPYGSSRHAGPLPPVYWQ